MTLWDIYNLVNLIVNKDFGGNIITPEQFKDLIKVVNIDLFRNKYGLPEEYQPGRPIPKEYAEITLKNMDDLKAFKVFLKNVPLVNGTIPYPADYCHRIELTNNFTIKINKVDTVLPKGIEVLTESQLSSRLGNYTKRPVSRMPICTFRSDAIYIWPFEVSDIVPDPITQVDFAYFRWPHDPVFAYVIGDGEITYDAVNSVEPEWPQDEYITLTAMLLKYIGINLRAEEIVQIANQQIQTGQ
jgi:hypothetical protein